MFLGRNRLRPPIQDVFQSEYFIFMDHSTKKRVFSGRKNVSDTVQTGSITLAAAQTAQVQSENAAIAHGLKRQNPELLFLLFVLFQHVLLRHLLLLKGYLVAEQALFRVT